MLSFKVKWLVLTLIFSNCKARVNEGIILTEDRSYEVLNIKVPTTLFKHLLHPTPVLKSSATIVLPVHVPEGNESEDYEDEENVINEEIVTESTALASTNEDQQPQISNDENPEFEVPITESTIQDVNAPTNQVQGQVFRFPCSCIEEQCGCCTGMILQRLNMKACGNISFVPEDFVFDVRMSINNNTVMRQRVSASDPPPICFNPRRVPFVRVCLEISNIRVRNQQAFACLDIAADVGGFPIYSASFRCFGLGSKGLQSGLKPKPVSNGPKPISLFGAGEDDRGSFLDNAAGAILGGGDEDEGIGGFFSGDDGEGPLSGIGEALGGLFGRRSNKT